MRHNPPVSSKPAPTNSGKPPVATGKPDSEKKERHPRPPFHRDYPEIGCAVDETKALVTVEGVTYPVRKYDVTFLADATRNRTFGSLKDAVKYIHPKAGRDVSTFGTLALLRAGKTIAAIIARRDPTLRDALTAAVTALRADLDWQKSTGIDVDAIETAEVERIKNVKTARENAKKSENK